MNPDTTKTGLPSSIRLRKPAFGGSRQPGPKSISANDPCAASPSIVAPCRLALVFGLTTALGLLNPSSATAQTQTYPCETVMQFGTGTSTNGAKLRPGSVDPFFFGTDATFPDPPDTYVVTDPPAAWILNSASADSQWIGPSPSTDDDVAGTSVYRLQILSPCAGAMLTGRYGASDRGVIRLNGQPISFPTPAAGWTTWTAFSFNNLLSGINRLEFYVTNTAPAAGGPPGPTGLRAELTVTATCCPCIVLDCPSDFFLSTCSNGAPANFSITGTNLCYTNLTITCSLAAATGIPVVSGSVFPVGTNTVICNASDTAGHRTNCSFRVIVTRDSQAPQMRCPRDIVYLCGTSGTNVFYNVTAADDTDPAPVVTCVPPSGSFFPPGTNNVICQARDACGNVSRCSFNVILAPDGFTKTLQAGVADNFSPAGFEPANPGPCLGASGYWTAMPFDTYFPGRHFSHSLQGLPDNLSAARLILHMKPRLTTSQDDMLRIGLQNCGGAGVWAFAQPVASLPGAGGTWVTNPPTTFTLDLAALPGGVNLLAGLNANHRLEFAVGTETLVDYARLEVTYCGPQSTLSGVPYSLNNVQSFHQGEGISWRVVNSNGPPATVEFDSVGADGVRLHFDSLAPDLVGLCQPYNRISEFQGFKDPPTLDPVAPQFVIAAAVAAGQTRVSLSQPNNMIGKFVEVWDGPQLISRHFKPGPGDTAVNVPSDACLLELGYSSGSSLYWYFTVRAPVPVDLVSVGQHVSGLPGPVVSGRTVRFYYVTPSDITPRRLHIELPPGGLRVAKLSLLRGDSWIEPYGPLQISISDVVSWHELPHSPGPTGVCMPAYGPWTLDLNGAIDFCNGDPLSICNVDHVDINLVEEINFGGLRITPGALGACTIENTVANSANEYIILHGPSGMRLLNGDTSLGAESLPQSVSGNAGPQALTVVFPPNTLVFAAGLSELYVATSATFHSQPQVLGQFYQVCVETTFNPLLTAPQFSFGSFQTFSQTISPACLTFTCPTNVIANCTNAGGTVVTFNPTGATRCGSNVVITCEPPSGSLFPPGASVVQCSAIDSQGNQEQCGFLVTVLPACPLTVTRLPGNRVELRWVGDVIIESAEVLGDRPVWRSVIGTPTSNGAERTLVLPIDRTQQFYRAVLVE